MADKGAGIDLPPFPGRFRLTGEFGLLAACSWIAPPAMERLQAEKITSLCAGNTIDWEKFIRLVRLHGVQAQAYENLRKHACINVPEEILGKLKQFRIAVSGHSLHQAAELLGLINRFAGQGIDVLPLKGIVLSLQLYGDPGMRTSSDIDILVKEEDFERAWQMLESEGYLCGLSIRGFTARQKNYIRKHNYHLQFDSVEKKQHLELHWNFGALWLPEHTGLMWKHIEKMKWMGGGINVLDNDALLLFLCDHGVRHHFVSLKWLADFAVLFCRMKMENREKLLEMAEFFDLKKSLTYSVLLAHWIYNIEVPDEFRELMYQDGTAVVMSEKAMELLKMSAEQSASHNKRRGGLLFTWREMRIRPSIPLKKVLSTRMIGIGDFEQMHLPDSLFWLYYPLRPFLWLQRYYLGK